MGCTDSLEVRGTNRSKDRNVSGTIDQVVRDGLLTTAGHDADRGHAEREGIVSGRLGERDNAAGVRRQGNLLAGRIGDGARRRRLGRRGCLGGRGRGGLVGRACSQSESGQSDADDGANSRRQVHRCLNSVDLVRCIGKPNL